MNYGVYSHLSRSCVYSWFRTALGVGLCSRRSELWW